MFIFLKNTYFQLQIQFLLIFKPSALFNKINQLNWYKNTLCQWVDDQNIKQQAQVLEVGCASGTLTAYIANAKRIPTGVDFSSEMVDLAKKNNKQIEFLVADVFDLPFENNYFDAVIAASLINIVDDKRKAISALYRTCKKGGVISILVPLDSFDDNNLYSLQTSINDSGFSIAAMQAWHKRAPKMSVKALLALFEQAGLTEITTKEYLQGMVISISARKSFRS
jgi:ubiquinone/menaquinone biosynthesis C-methylase UbiE